MTQPKGPVRPKRWKHTDPLVHRKYLPFLRARAQAHFRGEEFTLTFEEYCHLWQDHLWDQRGRHSDCLAMARENFTGPWSLDNCKIMSRRLQVSEANLKRHRENRNKEKNNENPRKDDG